MVKRYGWADVAGVLGRVFAPVADAVRDETGKSVRELVAAGRRMAAGVLRRWADALAGVPVVAPTAQPAAPPAAVPVPTPATEVPAPVVTPTAVPDAPSPAKPRRTRTPKPAPSGDTPAAPKRVRKSATAALLAERVADGADAFVRKGTRYVRCPDPARWNPADGSLYTRHGTGGRTRYTELIPARTR